jgi:hypothetical protein
MTAKPALPRWRTRTGTGLFLVGLVLPAAIPLLYMIDLHPWLTGTLTAAFAIGLPELMWVLAAIVIGKDGVRPLWRHTRVRWQIVRKRLRRFV